MQLIRAAALAALAAPAAAVYQLEVASSFNTYVYGEDAAEQIAYDPVTQVLLTVNKDDKSVDVIDISNPMSIKKTSQIRTDESFFGETLQAVTVGKGHIAIATVAEVETDNGSVALYSAADYSFIRSLPAGPHPEHLSISHDGNTLLVSNEGSANDDFSIDPKGSITLVDISNLDNDPSSASSVTITFDQYAGKSAELMAQDPPVHLLGPNADKPEHDLEPEAAMFNDDDSKIYVSLQDNNAIAVLDVASKTWDGVFGLGYVQMEMDASDKSDGIDIKSKWPDADGVGTLGVRHPDMIDVMSMGGIDYIFTANEGGGRDEGFSCIPDNPDVEGQEARLKDVGTLHSRNALITADDQLGRKLTDVCFPSKITDGKIDGTIYTIGTRSFSIYSYNTATKEFAFVWDSGSQFEKKLEEVQPEHFNCDEDEKKAKKRSDDKGAEPEPIVLGKMPGGETLAFIGLERQGGIFVYDVSDPTAPVFQDYINNRNFCDLDIADQEKTRWTRPGPYDSSPEGLAFIPQAQSPNGQPLLAVSNAVSGSTTVYTFKTSATVRSGDGSVCIEPTNPQDDPELATPSPSPSPKPAPSTPTASPSPSPAPKPSTPTTPAPAPSTSGAAATAACATGAALVAAAAAAAL